MVRGLIVVLLASLPWVGPDGHVVWRSPNVPHERIASIYDVCTGTVLGTYAVTAAHCVGGHRGPVRLRSGRIVWSSVVWDSRFDYHSSRDEDNGLDVAVLRLETPQLPYRPACFRRPNAGEYGYAVVESPFGRWLRLMLRAVYTGVDSEYGQVAVWYGLASPGSSGAIVWSDRGCVLGMIWYGSTNLKLAAGADGLRLWEVFKPWLE